RTSTCSSLCVPHNARSEAYTLSLYHAWSITNDGKLASMPGRDGFPEDFNDDGSKDMKEVERLESYRGFMFVNFDENAVSLDEYLGDAKEYIDLVVDQAEYGLRSEE